MYNYETYLGEKNILTFDESLEIYDQLIAEMNFNDEDTKKLWEVLIERTISYAAIRSNWFLLTKEDRLEKDKSRCSSHNSFIGALNMISRFQEKKGIKTTWRDQLGDEKENRKKIGDFACFIAYIFGINAR